MVHFISKLILFAFIHKTLRTQPLYEFQVPKLGEGNVWPDNVTEFKVLSALEHAGYNIKFYDLQRLLRTPDNTNLNLISDEAECASQDRFRKLCFYSSAWRKNYTGSRYYLPYISSVKIEPNVNIRYKATARCRGLQYLEELQHLSSSMFKIVNHLLNQVNSKIPEKCSSKTSAECECTGAKNNLNVVYDYPEISSDVESTTNSFRKLITTSTDIIFRYAYFLLMDNDFTDETQDLDFFKGLRILQRHIILYKFLQGILSDFIDDYFILGPVISLGLPNDFQGDQCRMSSAMSEAPILSTVYLSSLHMEIIKLPPCAAIDLFAAELRSNDEVLFVEKDISFKWDPSAATQEKNFQTDGKKAVSTHIAGALRKKAVTVRDKDPGEFDTVAYYANETSSNRDGMIINFGHNNTLLKRKKRSLRFPNDPHFKNQWSLQKDSPAALGLADAWPDFDILKPISSVVVSVFDSGLDIMHEDILENVWVNKDEIPNNGIDDDNNGYIDDINGWSFAENSSNLEDIHKHGTKISGIIAAKSDNGVGITSVCPFCKIMALKITCEDSQSRTVSSSGIILEAINYALNKKVNISNMSNSGICSVVVVIAIGRARIEDMIFIASAGNDNRNLDLPENFRCPASLPFTNIVSVASLDKSGELSSFSNYGISTVTLGAPGGDIWTSLPGNKYAPVSGTSFAVAHVTGLVGLLRGLNPIADHIDVIEELITRGNPLPSLQWKTLSGISVSFYNIFFELWAEAARESIE